jgi:hypothetical protein
LCFYLIIINNLVEDLSSEAPDVKVIVTITNIHRC